MEKCKNVGGKMLTDFPEKSNFNEDNSATSNGSYVLPWRGRGGGGFCGPRIYR